MSFDVEQGRLATRSLRLFLARSDSVPIPVLQRGILLWQMPLPRNVFVASSLLDLLPLRAVPHVV